MSESRDNTRRERLLRNSERTSTARITRQSSKFLCHDLLPFIIICVAAAPVAYILACLIERIIESYEPCQKRVVGYYTSWEEKNVSNLQLKKLTHVIFMFAEIQEDGNVVIQEGGASNVFLDFKYQVSDARKNGLKMMIAVGGHGTSIKFAPILNNPKKKNFELFTNLLASIVKLLNTYDIDGIEIFWMFSSGKEEGNLHLKLIQDVRQALTTLKISKQRPESYVLSTVISINAYARSKYRYDEFMGDVDFVNVLTYNTNEMYLSYLLALQFEGKRNSFDGAMTTMVCKTKKPSKFNLGVPFWPEITESQVLKTESALSRHAKSNYLKMHNLGGIANYLPSQVYNDTVWDSFSPQDLCLNEKMNAIKFNCVGFN